MKISNIQGKIIKKKKVRTAYHEAGHVVTRYLLTGNIKEIERAHIIKTDDYSGACEYYKGAFLREDEEIFKNFGEHKYYDIRSEMNFDTFEGFKFVFNEICCLLAGGISEMLYCELKRLPRSGMYGDRNDIYSFADNIPNVFPICYNKSESYSYNGLNAFIETCTYFLKSFLSTKEAKVQIKNIAEALLKHGKLENSELLELLKQPIPYD